ncbi:MAG: FAD:protein FMN transferase [bacterium]
MSDAFVRSIVAMDTVVTVQVADGDGDEDSRNARVERVDAALAWFGRVEAVCSRFDEQSELSALVANVGTPVVVSDLLFHAVQFALTVAEEANGAFDPTVGRRMEMRGFDREHRSGRRTQRSHVKADGASYRDVTLDSTAQTITLERALVLDLGAVAKGLAVDMAARELRDYDHFAVDAGGDLFFAGNNPRGEPWTVGIRHPRDDRSLIETISVSGSAVCTSGDYARRSNVDDGHHIIDARGGGTASALASVTVVGPTAMIADALATAAFVLGPTEGVRLLERHDVDGLLITPSLDRHVARGALRCFATTAAALPEMR